jgi:hypothetical protein
MAFGIAYPWTPNNWAFFLYSIHASFILLCIYNEEPGGKVEDKSISAHKCEDNADDYVKKSLTTSANVDATPSIPLWSRVSVAFAIFYSFGGLMLGLQEEATPNMFANLKVHGGSNHFFLPTGLLFHYYHHPDYETDHYTFGGGVVRIEHTTSAWMTNVYPADMTAILHPLGLAASLLERVGNPAPSFFNPGANRILGIAPKPTDDGANQPWYRYTVPALELKRLLREAKQYDVDFELTYAQLPGTKGDEVWRATAVRRLFDVVVRNGQVTNCTVTAMVMSKEKKSIDDETNSTTTTTSGDNAPVTSPCAPTDLPMLLDDAVPYWIQKISMYHAYPIVTNDSSKIPPSIVCFGP